MFQTRSLKNLLLLFLSSGLLASAFSQSQANVQNSEWQESMLYFEKKYGVDADLLNGVKYDYPYYTFEGVPYLFPVNTIGNICIKGKTFLNQKIRYDIMNYILVLDYVDSYGGTGSIVLRDEWVDHFAYGDMYFKKINDERGHYYQVIYEGGLKCYYHWNKDYMMRTGSGSHKYYFNQARKTGLLFLNGKREDFRNKRTFLQLFSRESRKEIKKYLKEEGIRFKKASDSQMSMIIKYCDQLISDEK